MNFSAHMRFGAVGAELLNSFHFSSSPFFLRPFTNLDGDSTKQLLCRWEMRKKDQKIKFIIRQPTACVCRHFIYSSESVPIQLHRRRRVIVYSEWTDKWIFRFFLFSFYLLLSADAEEIELDSFLHCQPMGAIISIFEFNFHSFSDVGGS